MSIRLTLGLSLSGLGTGQAVTFDPALYTWVDNSYTGETVDGTFDCPYKTMEAIRLISPNLVGTKATIYVKPGIYKENFALNKNGYTFVAYGDVKLRGSGSQVLKTYSGCNMTYIGFTIDAEGTKAAFIAHNYGIISFENCVFANPNTSGCVGLLMGAFSENAEAHFDSCQFTGNYGNKPLFQDMPTTAVPRNVIGSVSNCTINISTTVATGGILTCGNTGAPNTGTSDWTFTGCSIAKTGVEDFYIRKRGNYTFTNNVITYSADNNKPILYANVSSTTDTEATGIITFSDNSVLMGDYGVTATCDVIRVNMPSGGYEAVIENNIFSSDSETMFDANGATIGIVSINRAIKATVKNNTFDFRYASQPNYPTAAAHMISIQHDANVAISATGPYIVSGNLGRVSASSGYFITVGADDQLVAVNTLPGAVIEKNVFYGRQYYGKTVSDFHVLYSAWQDDFVMRYNEVIGAGRAIVIECNNNISGGLIAYNSIIDCMYGIMAAGINDVMVIGNTIISRASFGATNPLIWMGWTSQYGEYNEETNPAITGMILKNNIIYAAENLSSTGAAVAIRGYSSFAEGGCNNNCIYYANGDTVYADIGQNPGATQYTLTEWIALGYDEDSLIDVPELAAIALQIATANVDPRPIAGSNVIGKGAYLGNDYDDAMDIVSVPPSITTKEQPAATEPATDNWTIGAYIR